MLGNFPPFTTMQELNLDWILTKIKNILRFVPDDGAVGQILRRTPSGAEWSNEQGGSGAVSSVNGQTGDVVLDASDVGALPDTYVAPVTSVNGMTGDVVISGGGAVDSVNGHTGVVVLDAADVGALPDTYVAPVTSVNGQTGAVSLSIPDSTSDLVNDSGFVNAAGAAAAAPVQSVNGQTGAVTVPSGITITETGTTSDGYNTWNYRKWSNGDIDIWLITNTFNYHGSIEGPYNGMYRTRETRTLSILTDILWCSACGVNSCMFIAGVFINSSNSITVHAQGVTTAPTVTSASIYIKGKWQ